MISKTKPNHEMRSFLDLPDDLLMLALCVREENLKDPARWCAEMRALAKAKKNGPKTSAEADALFEWAGRLAMEADGIGIQTTSDAPSKPGATT